MRILGLSLLLSISAGIFTSAAQMTDEQVINYVKNGLGTGKSERQIGRELLARGVTVSQLESLKARYEQGHGDTAMLLGNEFADDSRDRLRTSDNDFAALLGQTLAQPFETEVPKAGDSGIYGHNVFGNRSLTFEPNENISTPDNYKLGPGDEIFIDIWGSNEANIRQTISPEGSIIVSQIGPIYLSGLTVKEAGNKVRSLFTRKYAGLSDAEATSDIRVTLGKIRSVQLNIMGEVHVPGTYYLSGFSSLFHALYRAGGVTPIGSLRNIRVVRNGKTAATVDVYEYLFNGKFDSDVRLQEGDVIIVPSYTTLVDIDGNVKRPMKYEMKEGENLADLIAYAGGFTGNAYTDELRITRDNGREQQIMTVANGDFAATEMCDGDIVNVGATLDRFANRIEIRGAVYRPGIFELGDRISTVRQLVESADGLKEDAFTARAVLLREQEDLTLENVAIDLAGIMDGSKPDIELRRNDVLIVSGVHELEEIGDITILGEVARPGQYPFAENTTIEDIILQAGGLLESASTVNVEVARRMRDSKSTKASSTLGEVFVFSLKDGFVVDGEEGFLLQPYDVVQVRRSPGYQTQRNVSVDGEVVFPGGYTLMRKNERLSDLVGRAGGVTPDAYVHGARLVRRMNDEERAIRNTMLKMAMRNAGRDSVSVASLELDDSYTVGIELDKALENPGSDYDMVLREGDRLIIPENTSTVRINGNVMYPNTVLFVQGKPVKYYISQAGGYGHRAKRSKAYVIHMNGTISRANSCKKGVIEPGCEIIVPSRPEHNGLRLAEILAIATASASVGTMAATIANILK